MGLIRWQPFQGFDKFFDGFDLGLTPLPKNQNWDLGVDLYTEGENLVAEMHLAGVDPDKVNISVENDLLTVSGSREEVVEEEKEDKAYFHREIRRGSFQRSIRLPNEVDFDQTQAEYKNGVLKITLPQKTKENKKINIKVIGN